MKKIILILIFAFLSSCAGTEKKAETGGVDLAQYFPIKDGCSWIYLVGKEGTEKKHYIVKVLSQTKNGGFIAWGEKAYNYVYKDDGVFNHDENSYILKKGTSGKWDLKGGTAEIVDSNDLSGNVIAVKESYPQKGFYTVSYYKKKKGLIRFEVYSLKGDNGSLIEKMELSEHLCSGAN